MENHLKELDIWCWEYLENTRNYPGLHLTAKPDACDALLRCLQVIEQEGDGAKRTISLKPLSPKDEEKITGGQKFRSFSALKIVLHQPTNELQQMCFTESAGVVILEIASTHLYRLRDGIQDIRNGSGDYSIGPDDRKKSGEIMGEKDKESLELWFWPCFGHHHVD
jgi:hypothetical protein